MCLPKILFPVSHARFYFFTAALFHQAANISHFLTVAILRYEIFMFFFQPNSCSLALSLLSMQV